MDEQNKAAYRHLLYVAFLEIRNRCQPRGKASLNPMIWRRRYFDGRVAGAIADWLHNLAAFSIRDFRGFDDKSFWEEGENLKKRYPFLRYREIFDQCLHGNPIVC